MESDVYPNEGFFHEHNIRRDPAGVARIREIQAKTKALGLWAGHLPKEAGGMGIGFLPYAYMNEILGRSPIAPRAFGAQAPDTGNAEILQQFGSTELQERCMKPLVDGDIRSLLLDDGARSLRRRPHRSCDARRARRRRVGDQRPQVVHQPARRRVLRHRHVRHRSRRSRRTAA